MTNNNLTDAEIKKALECCSMQSYPACKECPYHNNYSNRDCITLRNADIEDLINRLQAELTDANTNYDHIKQLWEEEKTKVALAKQKLIKVCRNLQTAKAEIERLQKNLEEAQIDIREWIAKDKQSQAEIERLKEENNVMRDCIDQKHIVRKGGKSPLSLLTAQIKAEAYKEFAERLKKEIYEALKSNYKARSERIDKYNIGETDEFISYCGGKIDCLRGLEDFIDNLLKELVGECKQPKTEKQIKVEIYRECIEKIKQRAEYSSCSVAVNTIADNVLKELKGE